LFANILAFLLRIIHDGGCDGQSWRVSFPLLRHLVDL